jgi:hypothetical protein
MFLQTSDFFIRHVAADQKPFNFCGTLLPPKEP